MTTKERSRYIYVNITEQSIALALIADILKLSKYRLFLLYETFSNDTFLFFELLKKAGHLPDLTEYRLRRCFQYAHTIVPVLLGASVETLSSTELRAYKQINPLLLENKLKIKEE